jgi:hypothetical protein
MPNSPVSHLSWRVKESFVDYVLRAPDGTIECRDGAFLSASGEYCFPAVENSVLPIAGVGGELRFVGAVNFFAHGGMLDVPIVGPWVVVDPKGAELTIIDPIENEQRITFVTLSVPAAESAYALPRAPARVEAAVAAYSSFLMGGVYPVGTELAPIDIHFSKPLL